MARAVHAMGVGAHKASISVHLSLAEEPTPSHQPLRRGRAQPVMDSVPTSYASDLILVSAENDAGTVELILLELKTRLLHNSKHNQHH